MTIEAQTITAAIIILSIGTLICTTKQKTEHQEPEKKNNFKPLPKDSAIGVKEQPPIQQGEWVV